MWSAFGNAFRSQPERDAFAQPTEWRRGALHELYARGGGVSGAFAMPVGIASGAGGCATTTARPHSCTRATNTNGGKPQPPIAAQSLGIRAPEQSPPNPSVSLRSEGADPSVDALAPMSIGIESSPAIDAIDAIACAAREFTGSDATPATESALALARLERAAAHHAGQQRRLQQQEEGPYGDSSANTSHHGPVERQLP